MTRLGRFLELSVPVTELLPSRDFWLELGYTELPTNDVRPWPYTALTDGVIVIGLHGGGPLEGPALSFVQPDVGRAVRVLEAEGERFARVRLGADEFNEALLEGPDGTAVLILEARTFSAGEMAEAPEPRSGRATGFALPAADAMAAAAFWERLGFEPLDEARRHWAGGGIVLDLDRRPWSVPALRYPPAAPGRLDALAAAGARSVPGGRLLRAPDGTPLYFPED